MQHNQILMYRGDHMNCDINEIKKLDLFHGIKESDLPGMMSCIGGQIKTYDKGQFISLEADEMK